MAWDEGFHLAQPHVLSAGRTGVPCGEAGASMPEMRRPPCPAPGRFPESAKPLVIPTPGLGCRETSAGRERGDTENQACVPAALVQRTALFVEGRALRHGKTDSLCTGPIRNRYFTAIMLASPIYVS